MARFLRNYEIQIQTPQMEVFTIKPPFTMKADVQRNDLASANKTSLTIFNLGLNTRLKIYKDRYTIADYWQMIIKAGYEKLITIFQGNIFEAYSYKQGTEWYTQIEGLDAQFDMQNSFTSTTVQKDTSQRDVINIISNDFQNLELGAIGILGNKVNKRGKVCFGWTRDILHEETDGKYFIDKERIYAIDKDEVISEEVIVLDSELLKTTPKKRESFLDCDCLFFPEAETAYICELKSQNSIYNGQYKISGFKHTINISGAECGESNTQISLYTEAKTFEVAQ